MLKWFGDKVKTAVGHEIDRRQLAAGRAVVTEARMLAPVRTGELRDSIGFTYSQSTHTLKIHADAPHAFFVEYGTRFMGAQPFLRPALAAWGRAWGKSEMQFGAFRTPGFTRPTPRANAAVMVRNQGINAGVAHRFRLRTKPRVVIRHNG